MFLGIEHFTVKRNPHLQHVMTHWYYGTTDVMYPAYCDMLVAGLLNLIVWGKRGKNIYLSDTFSFFL